MISPRLLPQPPSHHGPHRSNVLAKADTGTERKWTPHRTKNMTKTEGHKLSI